MDQAEVEKGAGPIGVIVVPTRELAEQIHKETRKFSKAYQLRVAAAFGGLSKFEQFKDLKHGSEVGHGYYGLNFEVYSTTWPICRMPLSYIIVCFTTQLGPCHTPWQACSPQLESVSSNCV